MLHFAYTTVLLLGLAVMAPVFALRAVRHRKYLGSLSQRFGAARFASDGRPVLWIHAVSVGELVAVEPLVRIASRDLAGWRVVVSTTTATGQRVASDRFPELDVLYFPLDLPFAVRRTLNRVQPRAVCLVETEIWPNFLRECRKRAIPVVLANGRLSDASFRGYRRAGRLLRRILDDVDLFLMQSESDAERMRALGGHPERVAVAGNLKYDVDREGLEERLAPRRAEIDTAFGLPDPRPLVVAGSTAAGEETLLGEALIELRRRRGLEATRMLVAPRHPERFDEAERDLASLGLRVVRRSRPVSAQSADVLLLDSIGELSAVYAHADVVFVGGSMVPRGGHNILEPALYGRPVVVGPHTENFRQIVSDFLAVDGLRQLTLAGKSAEGASLLASALGDLLANRVEASRMGQRAMDVIATNRGATQRTFEALRRVLAETEVRAVVESTVGCRPSD